jgi:SEC-C motif-containing protein
MASQPSTPDPKSTASSCPCGSGKPKADCCGPILAGQRLAATFGFLHRTYKPTAHLPYVADPQQPAIVWTRLVVHEHGAGRTPDLAFVDFSAYGTESGVEHVLHEKAEFARENGSWTYTRALREGPAPFKQAAPKPGRNDPCPCGSGKKYKHCCMLKP